MKPLQKTKEVLMWLSVFPIDQNGTIKKKTLCITFTTVTIACTLINLLVSFSFAQKFILVDFVSTLYAMLQATCYEAILYSIEITFLTRHQIVVMFEQLS